MVDLVFHEVLGFLEGEVTLAWIEAESLTTCIEKGKVRLENYRLKGNMDAAESEQYQISSWGHSRQSSEERHARLNDLLTQYRAALAALDNVAGG